AKAVAEALKMNRILTSLDIGTSSISEEGATAVAKGLKMNRILTSLDIGTNSISKEGATAVAKGLKMNSTLTSLKRLVNVFFVFSASATSLAPSRDIRLYPYPDKLYYYVLVS
ncbi:unnamed protein product, partial [Didymodactylos carnosus]